MSNLVLIVRLGGRRVAIRADAVSAVVELDEIAPVPRAEATRVPRSSAR